MTLVLVIIAVWTVYLVLRYHVRRRTHIWGLVRCPGCKRLVDPKICWCGTSIDEHHEGYACTNATPLGCRCSTWEVIDPIDTRIVEEPPLKKIYADFNCAQDEDNLMQLTCRGSVQSLAESGAKPGDLVLLSDGELEVEAVLVEKDSSMYARFEWNDIRDRGLT